MLEMIKITFDIHLVHKLHPPFGQNLSQFPSRLLRPAIEPITLIAWQKVCFVDGTKYSRHCQLY